MRSHKVDTADVTEDTAGRLLVATLVPGWFRRGDEVRVTRDGRPVTSGPVVAVDPAAGVVQIAARA